MDIKEFYNVNQAKEENLSSKTNDESGKSKFNSYAETINKYKDMPQDQLLSELMKEASTLKQNGSLTSENLEKLSATLQPMLNEDQQQMLHNIIERLK